MDNYLQKLLKSQPLNDPVIHQAIESLSLPSGSQGLDAGCGLGHHVLMLAEAVGSSGHVTGIDLSAEFIEKAKNIARKSDLTERVSFKEGNLDKLPFADGTFDWVWSSNCAGYSPKDPRPVIKELKRIVKPGGSVIILAWSSQQLLPGYPQLEAQLNATTSGIAPFTREMKPELHLLRALGWLREAGLEEATAHTFVHDVHAPLSDDIHKAMISLFQMRWEGIQSEVASEVWEDYMRLCQPESPDFILNLQDYYAFFTYSLFHGKVPE